MSAARAEPGPERLTGVAALLLLLAVAVGLLGQGGYYGPVQRLVGLLVVAATLLAMVARPPGRDDARRLPVVPTLALVAWALADAVLLGVPPAGGLGLALLVAGVLAVLFVCRRLGSGFASFGCTGGQDVVVGVTANPSGKAFVRGKAVVEAEVFGCGSRGCASETDSETVELRR